MTRCFPITVRRCGLELAGEHQFETPSACHPFGIQASTKPRMGSMSSSQDVVRQDVSSKRTAAADLRAGCGVVSFPPIGGLDWWFAGLGVVSHVPLYKGHTVKSLNHQLRFLMSRAGHDTLITRREQLIEATSSKPWQCRLLVCFSILRASCIKQWARWLLQGLECPGWSELVLSSGAYCGAVVFLQHLRMEMQQQMSDKRNSGMLHMASARRPLKPDWSPS